jgi:hypothetical protein
LATRGGDARAERRVVDERRRARASGSGRRTARLDAVDDAILVHVGRTSGKLDKHTEWRKDSWHSLHRSA